MTKTGSGVFSPLFAASARDRNKLRDAWKTVWGGALCDVRRGWFQTAACAHGLLERKTANKSGRGWTLVIPGELSERRWGQRLLWEDNGDINFAQILHLDGVAWTIARHLIFIPHVVCCWDTLCFLHIYVSGCVCVHIYTVHIYHAGNSPASLPTKRTSPWLPHASHTCARSTGSGA